MGYLKTHNNIGSKEREKGELGKSRDGEWVIREIDQCSKCIVCGVLAGLLAQLPHTHKHTHTRTNWSLHRTLMSGSPANSRSRCGVPLIVCGTRFCRARART